MQQIQSFLSSYKTWQNLSATEGCQKFKYLTHILWITLILACVAGVRKGRGRELRREGKGIRARDHARGRREEGFSSLLPRAPLAFLSRLKLPFPKLPFPSLSNACHAGYSHTFFCCRIGRVIHLGTGWTKTWIRKRETKRDSTKTCWGTSRTQSNWSRLWTFPHSW